MRVLVTGGGGFVGAALVRRLAQRGDVAIAFDRSFAPDLEEATDAGITTVPGDITDAFSVLSALDAHQPDAVIHCAAMVGVLASLSQAEMLRVNIGGSVNLFEAMARRDIRRVLHLSSEETLGHFLADRVDEGHPTRPVMAYGVSKLAVEGLGRTYRATHGIACINLRTSWVYGPGLPRSRVPKNFIDAALDGRSLHLPRGADSAIDHTYIDDLVDGVLAALDQPRLEFDTYNIASDSAPTVGRIVEIVRALVPGADISIGPGPLHHRDDIPVVRKGALAVDRARESLGYSPRFDIERGLAAYVAELRTRHTPSQEAAA
ncbi:UDP-glucose 4-epimerase [Ancylobacter aquaticus]|uniref:UDP-glucose 4-epimerase n=1 Tax=Ancylobacter aquaticus TaxID=100 RepID=A0A4R1I1X9_ANCAQ|nr:NAD(P)-dependent oxidoreductase [Ancylobacter aquaticus]TCK29207.1 UDP-glucose 4-epimerase [Ancylobacter aquaticus]